MISRFCSPLLLGLLLVSGGQAYATQARQAGHAAQVVPQPEQGTFILHKFAKAIGKETYRVVYDDDETIMTSDFLFTDRGSPVPLHTTYIAKPSLEPMSLSLDGRSSRISQLDDKLEYNGKLQKVELERDGKKTSYPAGPNTLLIDGYSPVTMQQMLMRFWFAHGRPDQIPTPPGESIHIQPSGDINVPQPAGGPQPGGHAGPGAGPQAAHSLRLHGYVVSGLIWGSETLWMDDHQELAALVTTDAEFDHFEAVRENFEPSLGAFIQQAARNNLDALAKLAAKAKRPPTARLAITNVTVIDGTGAGPIHNANVFIEDGVIARIDHERNPDLDGYDKLDGTGKYLIPGLWDMHAHYEQVEWGPIYLAAGVTTVRDCGNEFDFITTVRDALHSGRGIGPQIFMAGLVDGSGPNSLGAITADTPEQALAVIHRYQAAGAMQIKIYSSIKPSLVPVITAEAHRLGLLVTGHVPNGMTTVQAVEAGMDIIDHIQYPAADLLHIQHGKPGVALDFNTPDARRQIAVFQQHHTIFDDTISLYEEMYRPETIPLASLEPGITHVAPQLAEALNTPGIPESRAARTTQYYTALVATLRELHKDGIPIVAGTDQNIPGYSLHREMEIYVQAGFTPMQALQAATSVPARVMGVDKALGTLEVGKLANMVLLDADPLANIANTRRIVKTIAGGAVYDPAPLWQSVGFKP
jgi:imidazolonepropionase-like amidohydrolase